MSPRLEFLAYFVALLVGVSAYMVERPIAWPFFILGVVAYLVVLRFLCRQLAKRFRFDHTGPRTDP